MYVCVYIYIYIYIYIYAFLSFQMYLDSSVSFSFLWFRKDVVWLLYRSLKLVASPTYVSVVVLVVTVAWYTKRKQTLQRQMENTKEM